MYKIPDELHSANLCWSTPNGDNAIAWLARISNPKNQEKMSQLELEGDTEKLKKMSAQLINFCVDEEHWSILQQGEMCVIVKTTLAIAPQIIRHTSFDIQQFSLRYGQLDLSKESVEMPELRLIDGKMRNPSVVGNLSDELVEELYRSLSSSSDAYNLAMSNNIHPECARNFLPTATPTYIVLKGSCRTWFHYLNVRCAIDAQGEHQKLARSIRAIWAKEYPIVYKAWEMWRKKHFVMKTLYKMYSANELDLSEDQLIVINSYTG